MIVGVPVNEANVMSQKYRYIESFSTLNGIKLSFDIKGNTVINDLDGEYESLIDSTLVYTVNNIKNEKFKL